MLRVGKFLQGLVAKQFAVYSQNITIVAHFYDLRKQETRLGTGYHTSSYRFLFAVFFPDSYR